jgi:tetratricopeptide (TPR) repeat protein
MSTAKISFILFKVLSYSTKITVLLFITTSFCFGMSAEDLEEKAETFLANRQYDEAIEYYSKALETEGLSVNNRAIVYLNRGVFSSIKQLYDRAIEDFNKAIELNPGYAMAYNNRGNIYGLKQQDDKAIEDFNKAIELNPGFAMAYNNRGNMNSLKQQYDKAIEDFNKAIELNPGDYKARNFRGIAYRNKQQYDKAIEDFNKAIDLNPRYADAYYRKACVYSLTNKTEEACKMLKQSIKKGYNYWSSIKIHKDLDNIRDSSCYKEIMAGR